MKERKRKFPKIGMRIIKSACSVLLCFILDRLLRNGKGMVFYAQLSALWCMQDYVRETKAKAFQRTVGTVIGCLYGLFLLILRGTGGKMPGASGRVFYDICVAGFIVLILYTTVVAEMKQASYFSCVVFLSIVVNHAADTNPYLFVWNRFLDTMTGILVGIAVNCMEFPRSKNRDILFLSGLDDTLLSEAGALSAYSRVELNRMIEDGAKFTVSTLRTPAALMEPLREVDLKLPVIVMDGAALFYISEKRYERVYVISPEHSRQITEKLNSMGFSFFSNIIVDDSLFIYYSKSDNPYYNELVKRMRCSPYRNYICRPYPEGENVVYFMMIDTPERIEKIYTVMMEDSFFHGFKITREQDRSSGAEMLKIYNHNASKEHMTEYLKKKISVRKIVSFGTVKGRYTHYILPGDFNGAVKVMKKEYEPLKIWKPGGFPHIGQKEIH